MRDLYAAEVTMTDKWLAVCLSAGAISRWSARRSRYW
jgi:hypothetical protein